jgi:hypothetical protein
MAHPRIRLTCLELSTILGVAGDALASETLYTEDAALYEREMAAFESGMDKLRTLYARCKTEGARDR